MDAAPRSRSLFDPAIIGPAIGESFVKLDPRVQFRNPVMFVVEIGALVALVYCVRDWSNGQSGFDLAISFWLWFTVLFANFAEAVAEGRGKAQAEFLRKTKSDTYARRLTAPGVEERVVAASLRKGDKIVVDAGEIIPADAEIVQGAASVDESAITGESAPVVREAGGDRSSVTGGTRVLSDRIIAVVSSNAGESFLDRMIALVEGASRQKTPNEIALSILLAGLTIIFVIAVATLAPFSMYAGAAPSIVVLIALLVCLIPTTIGGLLSAIGIAGMDRVLRRNVLAMSGRAVEAAGDVDTLLLDKTGTITLGNRQAGEIVVARRRPRSEHATLRRSATAGAGRRDVRTVQRVHAHERARFRRRPQIAQRRARFGAGLGFGADERDGGVSALGRCRADRPGGRNAALAGR
jgi:K+-transporting ATPase ATPase B chain